MMRFALLLLADVLAWAPIAQGAEEQATDRDPIVQARAVKLEEQLRCLVCQNQTIAESNAELAVDLRRQVREQIAAGRSDGEAIDFMTSRYGDFVLYRPPLKATTVLLWGGPLLLLALGALVLARIERERRRVAEAPPLTAEERAHAEALLRGTPDKDSK